MKLFKAVNSYSKLQIESEPEIVRKGILIVDDSKFSRNILKDILKTEGHLIVGEAGDGLEAVAMAREKKPEYIFMDVEMPKLDGLGAIPKILEIDPKIKIVMCTALGQKNIILEAAKAGAKDYILKPYIKDNIIDVLHEITDKNQKEGQVIPFKVGKNHHDDINYKPLTEEEPQQPYAEEELQQSYAETELLQPLVNDDENAVNESLDSSFDQESLQESAQEEVLDSYLNEELQEKVHTEAIEEPKEVTANEEVSEKLETVTEGEAEENLANEEISEELETVTEDEETSEELETVTEGEAKESLANEETSEELEIVTEGEAEENLANEEKSEELEIVTEDEAEENLAIGELLEEVDTAAEDAAEKKLVIEEITDDETVERAKFVTAVLNEDNSTDEGTVGEAELEKTIADEEPSEAATAAVEAEPEEAIADENTSEVDTAAVESELEEAIADDDTSQDDTAAVEAEPEEAIADENTSEVDTAAVESELEEAKANDEFPENVISLEKTKQDINSDSNTYTYLWNNRFDLLQKEVIAQNSVGQRVSFYEYAYLDAGKYDTFIKDNLQREIALGMMKAYMSLDNRLQQDDSTTFVLRTLTYAKENRFFISDVLEESNDKFTEITIVNEIKYNSFKPKQTSQEITVKTGFYQLISDFVNGKSGRVLR